MMRTPRIVIGLVGPSGSGKSTVCRYFRETHGFVVIHAVAPLKRGFCAMFNQPPEACEAPLVDQPADYLGGVTPRAMLEALGQRSREIAPSWVDIALAARLDRMLRTNCRILVDGVRKREEADVIWQHRGTIVRMSGTDIDPAKPLDVAQQEVLEDWRLQHGPLDELHKQLEELSQQLLK